MVTAVLAASLAVTAATAAAWRTGGAEAHETPRHRIVLGLVAHDGQNPANQEGFVTSASVVREGSIAHVSATVMSREDARVVIDIETYDRVGRRIDQQWDDDVVLVAGKPIVMTVAVPLGKGERGPYVAKIGIFVPGAYWGALLHWNNSAVVFE
jgi:hypothetical protein